MFDNYVHSYFTCYFQKQMNDENHKWSCTTCSYANWPLARKCTLCLTPKDNVIDVETGKVKVELIQPPNIKWTCKVIHFLIKMAFFLP